MIRHFKRIPIAHLFQDVRSGEVLDRLTGTLMQIDKFSARPHPVEPTSGHTGCIRYISSSAVEPWIVSCGYALHSQQRLDLSDKKVIWSTMQ